jgi:hypothetical protein
MVPCQCCDGWICETHPDQPEGHDDCRAPGIPCREVNPTCPDWQGEHPLALGPRVRLEEMWATTGHTQAPT